jgi:hypothetical protein
MPVGELLRRTSSAELTEWAAYEQLAGPLGPARQDALVAQLCAVVANANRDKKSKKAKPKDFLPKWDTGRGEPQSWQQTKSVARMLNSAFGGTVNGKPTKPAPRYQVRTQDHLYTVVDTTTGTTEWTGLDRGQADAIAERLNHN